MRVGLFCIAFRDDVIGLKPISSVNILLEIKPNNH